MKNLEKYYGKELVYVITELKNGKITTSTQVKKVYTPGKGITFCAGCDIVIGDNSVNSKYIFDIGGIRSDNHFGMMDSMTLLNYCEPEQVDTVIFEHKKAIKEALSTFISEQQKRVNETIEILKTL